MDGRKSKILDYAKQNRNKPSKSNKNLPRGLLFRELGFKQRQDGIATEFQATAEDNLVFKFLEELHCQLPGASRSTFLMVFSPDGKKVASTHGNHNVYVTDLTTGKNVNTLSGHPRTPWCIAFHPSSNQILASGCLGGQVRVWDLHGGSELWMADGQTVIASLAFHPTDRLLVIATYNELHFWDWSQPEPFTRCYTNNEKEKVRYVAFDPLGHKLITGISNAPQVQTQWDRVMVNPPTNPDLVRASTSQAPAPQSHAASMMPPERERRITVCYRSLVEQYEQLMQRYFDLSRSRVIPTMDRGTDPMDLEAESSSVAARARERDRERDRDRDHVRMRDRDRAGDRERDHSQERDLGGVRDGVQERGINRERNQELGDRAHDSASSRERDCGAERDHGTITERDSGIARDREHGGNGDRDQDHSEDRYHSPACNQEREHNHAENRERGCGTDRERDRAPNTDRDRNQNHPVDRYIDPTGDRERDNHTVEREHGGEERDHTIDRDSDRNRDHDHSYNRSNTPANREQDNDSGNRDGFRDREHGDDRNANQDQGDDRCHDQASNSEQNNDHSGNRDGDRDQEHVGGNRNRDQDKTDGRYDPVCNRERDLNHAANRERDQDHSGEREDNDQSGSIDQEKDLNRFGCRDENNAGDNRDSQQGSGGDRTRDGTSDPGERDRDCGGPISSGSWRGNNNNSNSSSSTGGDRSISDREKSRGCLSGPWCDTNINTTTTTTPNNSISSNNSNSVFSTDPGDSTTMNTNNDNSSGQSGFSFDTCDSNLTASNNNNNSSGSSGHSRDRVFSCGACDTNSNIHHDSSDSSSDRHTCRHAFPEMVDSWLKCTHHCQWGDRGRQASTNSEQDAATSSASATPRPTAVPTERSRQELSRSRLVAMSMSAPRPIPWPDHPRLASGEAQTPGSDPNSATRDVAVGPTPRQEDPTSQGPTPSADSSRSEFAPSETSAHYCVFGRLHSQAQPAPPASPEQSGRRFFVSRRSAFQPRSPRSDPPPSPSTTPPRVVSPRYLFQRRFPGTDTTERERPEPEGRPTSPLTPMQRARLDMTDVGVRYGIQLLSRHIDNMQRLCRARLEILQLQQIRRLWEDLQRQIRSLHLAVRESTIALTGAAGLPSDGTPLSPRTSPDEGLGLGRGRVGQPRNSQAEGTQAENAAYLPNVSQMLEMARISDTSPQAASADNSNSSTTGPPRQTNPTTFTTSHLKSMMRARHLRAVKEALQSLSTDPGSSMASNIGNRDQPCSSSKLKPGPIKSCLKSGASTSSKSGRVTFSSDSSNIAWDTTEIISSNTTQGGNNSEENNASNATSESAVNIEKKQSDKSQHCPKKSYLKSCPSTSLKSGRVTFSSDNKGTASNSTEASSANVTEGINSTGSKSNSKCNVNRLSNEDTGEQSHTSSDLQSTASTADASVPSSLDASGSAGRTDATAASRTTPVESRPSRGGFWLVSTMDLTQPVPTTSTARTPTVTTPSVSGPRPSSFQMLQQRLLRIRSKVYLRRPRLLALGPRSMRRQPSLSRSHSSRLFRHDSGDRRPWFMQSVGRPQRSVNTAAQVGSSTSEVTRNASESSQDPNLMESSDSAGDSSTQTNLPSQTDPQPGPSRQSESTNSLVTRKTEGKSEGKSEGSTSSEGSAARAHRETSEGATIQKPVADSCSPCPTNAETGGERTSEEAGPSVGVSPHVKTEQNLQTSSAEPRPPDSASSTRDATRPSSSQQEPSTSESLLSMIARLERLVQQQREQRESIRSELSRERERESSNQSRRTNMWGLRVRPPWLRPEINSGSDSDSNPESERPQSWAGLSEEERLAFRQNSSSSRRNRPSQLDNDWEWTRESTRLRARQVLSLMVESLTQFFEENGLSNNTPHAVLDEQIYNLYVLLQLALELTDLLLAQLVSTRRELEHQWVHRLRSPVALDVNSTTPTPEESSGAGAPSQARERDRDREQRGSRGAREDPTLLFRQCFPYLCSGAGRSERHAGNRQEDSLRRLSARLRDVHPSRVRCVRGVTTRSLGRVMMARGEGPPRVPMRVSPGSSPSPRRSAVCHPPGSSGIMVRVQQYQQPTPSPAPGPSTRPGAPQQPDAFTVPLVQVNDVLIPDTSILLNPPRTRPQSPPPSAMHSPFLWARESRVGTWPELWRPRYLHPRYVGPGYYTDEQEEPLLGFPSENFNFIRGSSIVPDTVIITDAPMSPNHRIQVWDFSKCNIPDISNAEKNVIVAECKIHNDASVDVSSDGRLLVTLLPSGRLSVTTMLGVYSLQWESLGQCLYTTSFEQNAVSVSLSPTSRFLLVGLASRRVALLPSDRNTMAQIFELEGARPGRSVGGRGRLFHVRNIEQDRGHGYMSLNCIRWAPGPGQGFVYGTNTGQLKVLR